jgi:hypothetical protein
MRSVNEVCNFLNSESLFLSEIIKPKRICKRCLMDDTDINIVFTNEGCNHCENAIHNIKLNNIHIENTKKDFFDYLDKLKKNKQEILVGLSGGVDSSYLAFLLSDYGLTLNSIHLDNHWNSPLASNNIYNLVDKLKINFKNEVLNWETFKMLQLSLMKANVVDLEGASDHAIFSSLFKYSRDLGNLPIFHGVNISSENIMPDSWLYLKHDAKNLKSILTKFYPNCGFNYPFMSTLEVIFYKNIFGIKWISALDYFDYNKSEAEKYLINNFAYSPPRRKHEESLITKIYQRLILPIKFNIDKRKSHISSLIASNQITRDYGLQLLEAPVYTRNELIYDLNFFLNKLSLSESEFIYYLTQDRVEHSSYPNELLINKVITLKNKLF